MPSRMTAQPINELDFNSYESSHRTPTNPRIFGQTPKHVPENSNTNTLKYKEQPHKQARRHKQKTHKNLCEPLFLDETKNGSLRKKPNTVDPALQRKGWFRVATCSQSRLNFLTSGLPSLELALC